MSHSSVKYPAFVKWLAGLIIVLLLLPEVIRFAAIKTVASSGIGQASIDDVDFNLFTGELAIKQLDLTHEGKNTLSLDRLAINFHWLRLFVGEVGFESITVDGAQFAVLQTDQGDWQVVIPASAQADEQPSDSQAEGESRAELPKLGLTQLLLQDTKITVDSSVAQGVLTIDQLSLQRVSSWREVSPELVLSAAWNDAPIELTLSGEPFAKQPNLQGQLAIEQFDLASVAGAIGQTVSGAVDLNLTFEGRQHQNQVIDSSVEGELMVAGVTFEYGPLLLRHQELLLQTNANASLAGDKISYQIDANLASQGLSVVDQNQQVSLLNWEKLTASDIAVDDQLNVSFNELSIEAIDVVNTQQDSDSDQTQGSLHTGAVTVSNLSLAKAQRLVVEDIRIDNTQNQIVVQKDGRLQLASVFESVVSSLNPADQHQENADNETENEAQKDAEAQPIIVVINSINVSGDSYIEWQDLRFSVPVKEKIIIEQLTVNNIDQSQSDQALTLNLLSRVGAFSRGTVSGEVKPFAEKITASVSGKLEAVALPSLSPYTEAYLGYHLTTGQYDHEFDVDIADDQIKLNNKLNLRQLALSAVDPDKPQPMEQQLDVPLGLALNMLRDEDDNISLDVPIEGKLDDPNINITNIVNDALGKALKNSATSYLKYAIQPYGAVLMAAELVGDQVASISLDPIAHNPGGSELTPEHTDYISKVSALMHERPKLTIKLCGQSNESDKLAMSQAVASSNDAGTDKEKTYAIVTDEQLVELAKLRAYEVKRLLVDNGVDSKRVFSCQPQYKPEAINGVVMAI